MSDQLALVIEDDPDLAIAFCDILQMAGLETESFDAGDRALERLTDMSKKIPAVVVLDLHMPRVDGRDVLEQIRADERLAGIRVIIATSDARLADMLREQADLVLIKPILFEQLRTLAMRLATPKPPEANDVQNDKT